MSYHEITLKSELDLNDIEALCDDISTELNERSYQLDLDDYCRDGGSIGDACVEDLEFDGVDPESAELKGTFSLSFEESYHAGCRDLTWSNPWIGTAKFTLNTETGKFCFDLEAEREPEPEEDEP